MSKFDTDNLKKYLIPLLVIVGIIILLLIYIAKTETFNSKNNDWSTTRADGDGMYYTYGRGSKFDSISELLTRIEWASYLENRKVLWHRIFVISIIIVFFIIIAVLRKVPTPSQLILMILITFIPMYASHQLFYVHGDIYNDYYIKKNAQLIRKKLNLEKEEGNLHPPRSKVPDRIDVMSPK